MMNTRLVATVVAATLVAGTIAAAALAATQGDDRSAPAPAPAPAAPVATTPPPPDVQPLTYVSNPEDSEDATITDEMEANGGAGMTTEPPQ